MLDPIGNPDNQATPIISESEDVITQRGKTPQEVQADLLAGEPDDLSVEFTNLINYRGGGSN